jgi:predicted transcriptional regulator
MTRKPRQGTYQEFKKFTLDVVKGRRRVDPSEPKIWVEATDDSVREIQFHSLEAGAKLLSAKNRTLLRLIAQRHPKSVSELATLAGRAEQNVMRTLHKLSAVGLVRLIKGGGRAYQRS